ncbi:MAG: gamma-glutamylcyclotransferase family protein [Rhodovibrionaceae bacterium]
MEFFFYGTLLDADVRDLVMPHLAGSLSLCPATLPGFRRVQANCGYFPVLSRHANGRVEGAVVAGLDARALLLMAHFEGDEYLPRRLPVVEAGQRRFLWVFMPAHGGYATGRGWSLARWQRGHKRRLIRQTHRWMSEFGARSLASGDVSWRARRTLLQIARAEAQPRSEERESAREESYAIAAE